MADKPIVRIENSDTDMRFKQKCNSNFQLLARGLQLDGSTTSIINQVMGQNQPDLLDQVFNMVYPVGAGIWTNSPNDPRLSRGHWRQVKDVFLIAAGDKHANGSTGGAEEVSLTAEQNGRHSHEATATPVGAHTHTPTVSSGGTHAHTASTNGAGAHTHTASTAQNGVHSHYENARNDLTGGQTDGKKAAIGSVGGWNNNFYRTKDGGGHSHGVTVASAGNHQHAVTVANGGNHSHTVTLSSAGAQTPTITVKDGGDGAPHENMPPYLGRYYFERIS